MNEEFGESYSEILKRDLHLQEDGEDPKDIWLAICRSQQVPKSRWAGKPVVKRKTDTQ
jgi:hypothetical protein